MESFRRRIVLRNGGPASIFKSRGGVLMNQGKSAGARERLARARQQGEAAGSIYHRRTQKSESLSPSVSSLMVLEC